MPTLEIPESLGTIKTIVGEITQHVRPFSTTEINAAINAGYHKGIRALSAVRNQAFQSFVDPFTLLPNVTEYDVGLYYPPVWRPHRLLVGSPAGTTRMIRFRYRALTSQSFEDQETSASGTWSVLLYDILTGRLPGTAQAISASVVAADSTVTVPSVVDFQPGTMVQIPIGGPPVIIPGAVVTAPGVYLGVVASVVGSVLHVAPALATSVTGSTITPLRRRVMKIVPPTSDTISGRLFYNYRPLPLVADTDLLDPFLAEHRDMVIYYAVAQLLRAVNDADSQRWFEMAQEMRSELIQDVEPLAGQNSEAVETDINWGDY